MARRHGRQGVGWEVWAAHLHPLSGDRQLVRQHPHLQTSDGGEGLIG